MSDTELLLDRFIASFEKLDDMRADKELFPIAWQLAVGDCDEFGFKHWRPVPVKADPLMLDPLYAKLPGRFPPLFEHLVLSYRWAEVELWSYRLLANPPGSDLSGLLHQMLKDPGLRDNLLPAGYIQFGKGPDVDYDPVCFDTRSRRRSGDCRIVKLDHEEILCNDRVKIVDELAPSFEQLMLQTIKQASLV